MTTRTTAARRVEEEIANAGVPPQDNQAPLCDQDPVDPPAMTDGNIRAIF